MLTAIERADGFILKRLYQPAADMVTRISGRSCYWQGGQCAVAGGVCALIIEGRAAIVQNPVFMLLAVAMLFYAQMLWREAQRMERSAVAMPARSPYAATCRIWFFFLAIEIALILLMWSLDSAPDAIDITAIAENFAFTSFSYLLDCTPAAPVRRAQLAAEAG